MKSATKSGSISGEVRNDEWVSKQRCQMGQQEMKSVLNRGSASGSQQVSMEE